MFESVQMGRSLFGTLKLFSVSIWPLCLGSSSFGHSMGDRPVCGTLSPAQITHIHQWPTPRRFATHTFHTGKKGKRGSRVTRKRDLGVSGDLVPTGVKIKPQHLLIFSILKREMEPTNTRAAKCKVTTETAGPHRSKPPTFVPILLA
jgi:hypothetical protein